MSPWGDKSILPGRHAKQSYYLNPDVVDICYQYSNLLNSEWRTRIEIEVFGEQYGYPMKSTDLQCCVESGSDLSVFQGSVAYDLDLPRPEQQELIFREIRLANSLRKRHLCCVRTLYFGIGSKMPRIPVLFPVRRYGATLDYRTDIPFENVLGMRGLLDQFMLCLSTQKIFLLRRKQ